MAVCKKQFSLVHVPTFVCNENSKNRNTRICTANWRLIAWSSLQTLPISASTTMPGLDIGEDRLPQSTSRIQKLQTPYSFLTIWCRFVETGIVGGPSEISRECLSRVCGLQDCIGLGVRSWAFSNRVITERRKLISSSPQPAKTISRAVKV